MRWEVFSHFSVPLLRSICVCILESGRRINAASRRIFCSFSRFSFSYTVWGADPRAGARRQWGLPPRLPQMDVGSKLIFNFKGVVGRYETNGARHNTVLGKRYRRLEERTFDELFVKVRQNSSEFARICKH